MPFSIVVLRSRLSSRDISMGTSRGDFKGEFEGHFNVQPNMYSPYLRVLFWFYWTSQVKSPGSEKGPWHGGSLQDRQIQCNKDQMQVSNNVNVDKIKPSKMFVKDSS